MLAQLSDFQRDTDSVTPLYVQLANKLSSGITSGDWRANKALPSERMLSDMLDISRVSILKAAPRWSLHTHTAVVIMMNS